MADKSPETDTTSGKDDETKKVKKGAMLTKRTNVWVNGVEIPETPLDIPAEQHIRELIDLEIRDDDVFVAAYPKCGTHWMWEVTQMLIHQTTNHEVKTKEYVMMEFVRASTLADQRSPRIFNSHLFMVHLPKEFVTKKTKILHIIRNPKDVFVSMYHHINSMHPHTWEEFFNKQLNKENPFGTQFDYLRQMVEFQQKHPDHPVKTIYYEDMKKDPVSVTKELADFLQVPATESFCREVADACSFDQLKKADESRDMPENVKKMIPSGQNLNMYRKGIIGDWKTHFTVAQNERCDDFIRRETEGLSFTFTYE